MDAAATIAALGALAHDTRLAVFRLLVERGPEGLPAGAIAHSVNLAPSSLSFHLQLLTQAHLITQRRLGRQLIYAAQFETMTALVAYLTENCCGGPICAAICAPVCAPEPERKSA